MKGYQDQRRKAEVGGQGLGAQAGGGRLLGEEVERGAAAEEAAPAMACIFWGEALGVAPCSVTSFLK